MKLLGETDSLFNALRKSAKPKPVSAIEKLIQDAPDRELCPINALAFATKHKLDEDELIAAFLHGTRLGLFETSWNILYPACGGVPDSGTTLADRRVDADRQSQAERLRRLAVALQLRFRLAQSLHRMLEGTFRAGSARPHDREFARCASEISEAGKTDSPHAFHRNVRCRL
jgi:hypothetical protein